MEFNNPKDFAHFLRDQPEIKEILPWSNELIHYCDSINKGCNCKRNERIRRTEEVYIDIVTNIINQNKDIHHFLKKFSGESTFVFRMGDDVLLEIS